jgi:hypothetical protein
MLKDIYETDENGTILFDSPKIAKVDEERINIINQMTPDQKEMFIIGMCFYSAYCTYAELKMGKAQSECDVRELELVKEMLKRQNLKSEIISKQ